jgi:hypothetical protein
MKNTSLKSSFSPLTNLFSASSQSSSAEKNPAPTTDLSNRSQGTSGMAITSRGVWERLKTSASSPASAAAKAAIAADEAINAAAEAAIADVKAEDEKLAKTLEKLQPLFDRREDFETVQDLNEALLKIGIDINLNLKLGPNGKVTDTLLLGTGGTISAEGESKTMYTAGKRSASQLAEGLNMSSCDLMKMDSSENTPQKSLYIYKFKRLLLPFFKSILAPHGSDSLDSTVALCSVGMPDEEMKGKKIGFTFSVIPANQPGADGERNKKATKIFLENPVFEDGTIGVVGNSRNDGSAKIFDSSRF